MIHYGGIQFVEEDLAQEFRLMLWEAVTDWAETIAKEDAPPAFRRNPVGVVIRKTQARIRQWYRKERARYHIERALNVKINERGLPQYVRYWKQELAAVVTPGEKRWAQTVLKIVAHIGDQVEQKAKAETQVLVAATQRYNDGFLNRLALAALNGRAIDDTAYQLLTHPGPIGNWRLG